MLNLKGRRFCVLGLQGSGKTINCKYLLSHYPRHLVYDPLHEYNSFNRYKAKYRSYTLRALEELNTVIKKLVIGKRDLFIIDEANRYCPNKRTLPDQVGYLNDFNRHLGLGFGVVARRPAQLNTDLISLAHDLFIYRLVGARDIQRLEEEASGMGEMVKGLEKYHFVHADELRNYRVCPPVPLVRR